MHPRSHDPKTHPPEVFHKAFEATSDMICVLDQQLVVRQANAAMTRFLRLAPEQILGRPCHALVHGTVAPPPDCPIHRMLQTLRREESELFIPAKNLWLQITVDPILDAQGALTGIVHILRDITGRKQTEHSLARASALNASMTELAAQLMAAASIDDICDLTLSHALRLTGSRYGFVGYLDPLTGALVSPTLSREIWQQCQMAEKNIVFQKFDNLFGWVITRKEPVIANLPAQDPRSVGTPAGHVPIQRFLSVPALDGPALVGQIAVANAPADYTALDVDTLTRLAALLALGLRRAQAEKELRESRLGALNMMEDAIAAREQIELRVQERTLELQTANRELEAFCYSVSHDLRAPLRAINGHAHILAEDHASQLDEQGRKTLEVIAAETIRMGRLIDDLLTFSRMSRRSMDCRPVDMTALARATFEQCQAEAKGRQIEFQLDPLPAVWGDPNLLRQALFNLISNACKYTRPRPHARIRLSGHTEDDEHRFRIEDNGVGFDMRYADKLFGVFQRLHTDDQFEGTGVGLAIVQRILHRHGGSIWAESRPDEGTTFHFTLPAPPPPV